MLEYVKWNISELINVTRTTVYIAAVVKQVEDYGINKSYKGGTIKYFVNADR